MLKQLNNTCIRLWKDESGVVLAMTVVMFLTLFVISSAVFVVGENIRLRVEVQNAADAAAYTAAIVQADALSRIAAINRAMGWTYAQQVKLEMDFIVNKWLMQSLMAWLKDYIKVRLRAMVSTCSLGPRTGWDDYYCGQGYFNNREAMELNGHDWVDVKDIVNAIKSAKAIRNIGPIIKASANIKGMNKAEAAIIKKLEDKIHKAVKKSLKENIKQGRNDRMSKDKTADIRFVMLTEPKKCFTVMDSEHMFLRSVFGRGTQAKDLFGIGTDVWFVENGGGEIGRHYEQAGNTLESRWSYYGNTWVIDPLPPFCIPTIPTVGSSSVKGQDGYAARTYETAICEPQWLTPEYFEKAGAIVVGVARKLHNPFQFMFRHKKPDGIYGLYSVPEGSDGGSHYIWGVATTRAGYRDHGRAAGSYNPTVDSWEQEYDPVVPPNQAPEWWRSNHGWAGLSPHNLTEPDWDAVFIPLHRAWSQRDAGWQNRGPASGTGGPPGAGRWQKETASDILNKLWKSSKWESLQKKNDSKHGLNAVASDKGPKGMGGNISYGGQMEDHVYH
ncbi:MAG: hypothetical protein V1929_01210 [bacterium]